MIAIIRNIVRQAAALAVSVLALASCSDNPADNVDEPSTVYRLGFFVNVGDNANATRAASDKEGYNPGAGWENHIDIKGGDIRVVLFNPDESFLTEITDFEISPVATYESSKLYYINAATKTDISSGEFKIMIAANWGNGNYPADWTFNNIFSKTYGFRPGKPLSQTNLIPLYGIKDCKISGGIRPDIAADLGTIHLLRAMAKIEVIFTDDIYTIKKLSLRNYNSVGFCAPGDVKKESDYVHGDWNSDYTRVPSIPTEPAHSDGELQFMDAGENADGKNSYILYVPEYCNTMISPDNPESTIEIAFNEGFGDTRRIYFRDKTTSSVRDILRNVWYRFNITKKSESSDIEVEVDVLPYHAIDLEPDFGLTPDQTE